MWPGGRPRSGLGAAAESRAGHRQGLGLLGRPRSGAVGRPGGGGAAGGCGGGCGAARGPPPGLAQSACAPAGLQQLGVGGPGQRGAEAEVPAADGRWEGEAAPSPHHPRGDTGPGREERPPALPAAAARGLLLAVKRRLPRRRFAAGRGARPGNRRHAKAVSLWDSPLRRIRFARLQLLCQQR